MRVRIGKYKNWCGPYQIAALLKHFGVSEDKCHDIGEVLSNTWLYDICEWVDSKRKRKIDVRIDHYDTWSMDHTLSLIILPMLKQIRDSKHGSPYVDDEDVPKELRLSRKWKKIFNESYSSEYTEEQKEIASNKFHARWAWVLDEMIWAFEQIATDNDGLDISIKKSEYKKFQARIDNGTRLFGKYYRCLWD
jgi:hypothetical protein